MAVLSFQARRELAYFRNELSEEAFQAVKHALDVCESKHSTIASCAAAQARLQGLRVQSQCLPIVQLADRCVLLRRAVLEGERFKAERGFNQIELRGRLVLRGRLA